jgi:hypothetical protein
MVVVVNQPNQWAPLVEGITRGLGTAADMAYQSQQRKKQAKALVDTGRYTQAEADAIIGLDPVLAKELMKDKRFTNVKYQNLEGTDQQAPLPEMQQQAQVAPPQQQQPVMQPQQTQTRELLSGINELAQLQRQKLLSGLSPSMGQQQGPFGFGQQEAPYGLPQMQLGPTGYSQAPQQSFMNNLVGLANQRNQLQQQMQQPQIPTALPQAPAVQQTQQTVSQPEPAVQQDIENPAIKEKNRYEKMAEISRNNATLATQIGDEARAKDYQTKAKAYDLKAKNILENLKTDDATVEKYVDPIFKEAESARDSMDISAKQRELVRSGNLSHPLIASIGKYLDKALGEGVGNIVLSGDTQQLNKLTAKRFENIQSAIGGVPRGNKMIELYLQGFIRDTNSKEAMDNILKLTDLQDIKKIWRENLAKEINKKNGGYYPRNFKTQLSDLEKERKPELGKMFEEHLGLISPQESKELTDDQIDKFLAESNGDPTKAKELARQAGFEV